jgi:hypothetical protein
VNQVFDFIQTEETSWKTTRVPLTNAKDWNMPEHIERCLNVSNGWYHSGKNDGSRPYEDIVTPIIDVAFRLEGFDVKDILPYVDDIHEAHKSFLIKKYHPQWARKYELDSFIDEVVESSIIFDLVLIKNVNKVRPEVIALQDLAFCDQTDILSGPICIRHQYSIPDLLEYKGKWNDDKIDEVIVMAKASKTVSTANDREVKTPGKYIECFELHGSFPESWRLADGNPDKYEYAMYIVNFYTSSDGTKNGILLYSGKSEKITKKFKALKIDKVRSKGRACGKSIVERLFEPQVSTNYSAIKERKMLDAAVNLLQTDSEEYGNKKISQLPENTIIKHEPGKPISRVDMSIQNLQPYQNLKIEASNSARTLGSASEASLGKNPTSGTPFALQELIVQEGEGIHEYRQGKIATFFADELYRDWFLESLVKEMNQGQNFSEELSLDELEEVSNKVVVNESNQRIKKLILSGQVVTKEQQDLMMNVMREEFKKGGNRKFFEIMKDDFADIPLKVKVNISGKQKNLAQNADKLSKLITNILSNYQIIQAVPGIAKTYNQLIEASGLSPIDFGKIIPSEIMPQKELAQPAESLQVPAGVV